MLGFVSLTMDVSSEIVHSLLPVFLTTTLGVSVAFVGLIDGIAESTALIVRIFSGYLSDRLGRRKLFILLGYGLSAVSKPPSPRARLSPKHHAPGIFLIPNALARTRRLHARWK